MSSPSDKMAPSSPTTSPERIWWSPTCTGEHTDSPNHVENPEVRTDLVGFSTTDHHRQDQELQLNQDELHLQLIKTLKRTVSKSTAEFRSKSGTDHASTSGTKPIPAEAVHVEPKINNKMEKNTSDQPAATSLAGAIFIDSFDFPRDFLLHGFDMFNLMPMDDILNANIAPRVREFTLQRRLEDWVIERCQRKTGRYDSYYKHLRSDTKFRSVIEVVNFILYEAYPRDKRTTQRTVRNQMGEQYNGKRKQKSLTSTLKRQRRRRDDFEESLAEVVARLGRLSLRDRDAPSPPKEAVVNREGDQPAVANPPDDDQAAENPNVNPPLEAEANPRGVEEVDGANVVEAQAEAQAQTQGGGEEVNIDNNIVNNCPIDDDLEAVFAGLEPLPDGQLAAEAAKAEVGGVNPAGAEAQGAANEDDGLEAVFEGLEPLPDGQLAAEAEVGGVNPAEAEAQGAANDDEGLEAVFEGLEPLLDGRLLNLD